MEEDHEVDGEQDRVEQLPVVQVLVFWLRAVILNQHQVDRVERGSDFGDQMLLLVAGFSDGYFEHL